jgi:phosphotransferase system enzyme I (PtsI)
MVVGLGDIDLAGHETAIVDGDSGRILLSPAERDRAAYGDAQAAAQRQVARETAAARNPAITADNVPVAIMMNVAGPDELGTLDPAICDGIGLVRTEFLFHAGIPDEDAQFHAYRRIIDWAAGRPVVLRTLDAGGDKPIAGLTLPGESNPFLGTRGIRLSLARPDIFACSCARWHGRLPWVTPG